jgi:hypothetical protein
MGIRHARLGSSTNRLPQSMINPKEGDGAIWPHANPIAAFATMGLGQGGPRHVVGGADNDAGPASLRPTRAYMLNAEAL